MGEAGEAQNITHQQKKMGEAIVAAAGEPPDVVVAPVLHQRGGLGVLPEEVLADVARAGTSCSPATPPACWRA
jgi:hypothetical protein